MNGNRKPKRSLVPASKDRTLLRLINRLSSGSGQARKPIARNSSMVLERGLATMDLSLEALAPMVTTRASTKVPLPTC
jgi:hypothetical protein